MSEKHTPGPLQVLDGRKLGGKCAMVTAPSGDGGNLVVAEFHFKTGLRLPDLPALDNAALYAAAPDLLDVLKTTRGNIVSLRDAGLPGPMAEWLRVVDAAIAKATGKK